MIHKRSTAFGRSVKCFTGGLKPVSRRANLTLCSDVDQDKDKFGLHKSKKEGKDQESIQSNTTPDPGYQWKSDNGHN